jgi:hypothetical protein
MIEILNRHFHKLIKNSKNALANIYPNMYNIHIVAIAIRCCAGVV